MISQRILSKAVLPLLFSLTGASAAFAWETPQQPASPQEQQQPATQEDTTPRGGHMRGMGGGGNRGMMQVLASLDLSDSQNQQVQAIMHQFQETSRPQREEMRRLGSLNRAGTLSEEDQAKAKQLQADMQAASKKMRADVLAVLTPDQQAKFKQAEKDMRAKRAGAPVQGDQQ
jgi:Spy/CpxP family protein refolding chaperone